MWFVENLGMETTEHVFLNNFNEEDIIMIILKKFAALVLSIALASTMLCSTAFAEQVQTQKQESKFSDDYLESVRKLIKQKYSGSVNDSDLNKPTINEMFKALDKYSVFYSLEEYESFSNSIGGEVNGIGVVLEPIGDYITILKVYDRSPAQKAGLLKGDRITKVNGVSVVKSEIDDVVSKIKGITDTEVEIGIQRVGVKNELTFEIVRSSVDIPNISYEVRGDIGYILMDMFSANAFDGVKDALKEFDNKKVTKLVIDLRNNPGGLLDQAVFIAQLFVPKGLITSVEYKDEEYQDESYYSSLLNKKYKLAVLVNENSASASEIFTGAIKDSGAGVIIGNKTFGKAKVQSFVPVLTQKAYERFNKDTKDKTVNAFKFGSATKTDLLGWAKMTIGMYYTPNGDCIDLKGIEPNVKVEEGSTNPDGIKVNEIPPLNVAVKPTLGTKCNDVYNAERILRLLKYDVGKPDTTLDKKTFLAIAKFQKDNKVHGYGVLDFCTQKLLNQKLDVLLEKQDPVYLKAVSLLK